MKEKKLNFTIVDNQLVVEADANDLDAFRWNAPGDVPVFFIFIGPNVHIITLEADDQPFSTVVCNTMSCPVREVTEEELEKYKGNAEALFGKAIIKGID